ncbi:MAG: hypothetical protein ACRC6K_00420 [Fusobacteriaceae bacterium]
MNKTIVRCPKCKEKMKIGYKVAKYRCPTCKEIYKLTRLKLLLLRIKGIFLGIIETTKDIKKNIYYKYKTTKATAKYMAQVKKNMKKDPNWSNFHKEQREIKEAKGKRNFKNIFKRKK